MITANVSASINSFHSQKQAAARSVETPAVEFDGLLKSKAGQGQSTLPFQQSAARQHAGKQLPIDVASAFGSSLTEAQLAEVIARNALPTAAANAPVASKSGTQGNGAANAGNNGQSSADSDPALEKITSQFKERFAGQAGNKEEFHSLMKKSFGNTYDVAKAENIRQQTLKGDFGWMPEIKVVDAASLKDTSGTQGEGAALGAFSSDNNTVYLSRELLNTDPARAEKILTEEVGHSIDTQVNKNDAAGDEGAIFSRLSHGENISSAELKSLRAENDSGVIEIDGRKVEVEYGFFSKIKKGFKKITGGIKKGFKKITGGIKKGFKKIAGGIKKIGKSIKKGLSKAWKKVKGVVKKVLTSKVLGYVLAVAKFIPIPVVQAVATVLNVARSAYSVYQGVKNKSWGAVLGGVAGVAGGVAKFGGALGMSQSALKTAGNIATHAGNASKAYTAISQKNFGTAAALAANYFGATSPVGKAFETAAKIDNVYQKVKSDDPFGAISAGATLLQDYTGSEGDKTLQSLATNANAFGQVQKAINDGDYSGALAAANTAFGDQVGLSDSAQQSINQFTSTIGKLQSAQELAKSGDYLAAGQTLLQQASSLSTNDGARAKLQSIGEVMVKVDAAATAIKENRFDDAAFLAADALGKPMDNKTRTLLTNIQNRAEQVVAFKDAVEGRDVDAAARLLGAMSDGKLSGLADQFTDVAGFADNVNKLRHAINTNDYASASATAADLAEIVAGKNSKMASTLDVLADILGGKVQISLGDILSGNGATPGINPAIAA